MSSEEQFKDNSTANNNNRSIVPIDTDDNPVNFYDNPAHIEGALEEFRLFCDCTGHFLPFFENRAVSLPNGKIAVELSDDSVLLKAIRSMYASLLQANDIARCDVTSGATSRQVDFTSVIELS
jgi:hypothetical protein